MIGTAYKEIAVKHGHDDPETPPPQTISKIGVHMTFNLTVKPDNSVVETNMHSSLSEATRCGDRVTSTTHWCYFWYANIMLSFTKEDRSTQDHTRIPPIHLQITTTTKILNPKSSNQVEERDSRTKEKKKILCTTIRYVTTICTIFSVQSHICNPKTLATWLYI